MQGKHWFTIIQLAFQCIGVVFGDLGMSPLYVLWSTILNSYVLHPHHHNRKVHIYGLIPQQ
ncbi:hypothetical protein IMY05_008G0149600 [Salix suchowensis]|nr:hypothetical protein IMY05_008G0149600 [Salix suchowensis]